MDTNETVALFTMLGVILAAVFSATIPAWLGRRSSKNTNDAIGVPNGHGTVVEMLGKLLDRHASTDVRIARLEERAQMNAEMLARHGDRLDKLETTQVVVVPPPVASGLDPTKGDL